jgi:hypothetical protein
VIVKWLVDENLIVGLEGIVYRTEVVSYVQVSEEEFVSTCLLFVKSASLLSSKRQFTGRVD